MPGHKYSPDKCNFLTNPIRNLFMPARKILSDIHPQKTEIWADIGCGSGFLTIPLSMLVSKVYAIDISDKMLMALKENLNKRKIKNVDLLQNEESLIPLEDSMVNGVLLAFVAHELNDPQAFLHEINRVLIPEGRLIIVEFSKEQTIMGPPLNHRLSEEQVDVWTNDAGLKKGGSWRWSKAVLGWEFLK